VHAGTAKTRPRLPASAARVVHNAEQLGAMCGGTIAGGRVAGSAPDSEADAPGEDAFPQ